MPYRPPKQRRCDYRECTIPENNQCYIWQFLFLLFSVTVFWLGKVDINFFNIALFLVPIILDLIYTNVSNTKLSNFMKALLIIDCFVMFAALLNLCGMLYEENGEFYVNIAFVGKQQLHNIKLIILTIATSNLIVPIIFGVGRPTKKTLKSLDIAKNKK